MNTGVLTPLRSGLGRWLALRALLAVSGAVGLLALAAVLSDAALDLPENVRVAAPWVLAAAAAAVSFAGLREWRSLSETRLARLFERMDSSLGNRLTNAVQLAQKTGATPVEEFLRRDAVELGRSNAGRLNARSVVRQRLKRAAVFLGGVALAWAGLYLAGTNLLQTVLPRFLDARGDHPPYSRLKIDVTPGRAEVLYGGQIEVRAAVKGRPVDKLWLVARAGTDATRAMMFLAPDKSFFQTLANLRDPTEYFVTDGTARSRRFPVRIRYTPQMTMVEVTETFPEYTSKPARTMKLSDEVQSLPEGTRVRFRVASNRPLKSGALELTPVLGGKAAQVTLKPEAQNTIVSGDFVLNASVAFNLSVRDVGGLDCAEPRRGRFNLLPDERPRLFVLEPGRDAVATPSIRVPVRVQASDDYAVSRIVWLRGFNHSVERPFNMKLTLNGGSQSVESTGAFDLGKLGVRPGDAIDYYFEAADNYPKGPNVVFSRPFRLEIISDEQYQAILRQAAARKALFEPYFKLDAWLKRLAERARALEAKADTSNATARDDAQALAGQLEKYQQELGKLLRDPAMFDVEQSFRTSLVVQHTRVEQAAAKLKQALGGGQLDPKALRELSDQLNELAQTEEEQVNQPARQIAAVVQLLARADTFVKLAQEQALVARMLRRFSDRTNDLSRVEQMEVQELLHQQRRIQEALHTLLGQLPELLAKVPADAPYDPLRRDVNAFLQAVADARIEDDQKSAADALEVPNTMLGYALAQAAAEKMDRLIARCSALPGQGEQCLTARFQPKLSEPGLGNSVGQILAALGAGNGQGGGDGYALFNEAVGLYGPNAELAGEQAGGRTDTSRAGGGGVQQLAGDARDSGSPQSDTAGHVRLQPDAKFPLRYRDLVGEYFRAIAESQKEGDKR